MVELLIKTFETLAIALKMLVDCKSLLVLCEDAKGYPLGDVFTAMCNDAEEFSRMECQTIEKVSLPAEVARIKHECGAIKHLAYPFIPLKYLDRGSDLMESTKRLWATASSNSELSHSGMLGGASDVFGVFATRDIGFAELIVEDNTALAASNFSFHAPSTYQSGSSTSDICENCYGRIPSHSRPVFNKCCGVVYCSPRCRSAALESYHKVLCGKDFDWLYQESASLPGHTVLNGPMWLRLLAAFVQSDCHPLEHPAIARLTPLYNEEATRIWSFSTHVTMPIRILRQLGIELHSDLRYDIWVLQTVWARVINNQSQTEREGRPVRSISSFYSFFNHSCEPNTGWSPTNSSTCIGGSTKDVFAKRHIKKGEELCISYLDAAQLRRSKAERHEMLASWLGLNLCHCSKCQRVS